MTITSFSFVGFVFASVGIYYLLPRRAQIYWLLACSYIFHISWAVQFAMVLFLSTLANFWLARRLHPGAAHRPGFLWVGIGFNLLTLVVFRLADFYVPEITTLLQKLNIEIAGDGLRILVPVGISYYVLENISYLVDVYRGQMKASDDLIDFGLYLAYFPKLLAGPIERARSFLPKLGQPRLPDQYGLARSATLIFVGLTRKIIVADTLAASIPAEIFSMPVYFSAPELWFWLIVYAFALYNDFAGYTSIVRGVSGLFGIELSANFNYPYFARNFSEFWNRWHISLSHWLRDYIYYPLSRWLIRRVPGRNHPVSLIIPPLVTMLASGLWHGFHWHMLLWGGLHGLYLVLERLYFLWQPAATQPPQSTWRQVVSILVIFLLVTLAWVPFRMDIPVALAYWKGLLNWTSWSFFYNRVVLLLPLLAFAVGLDWLQSRKQGELTFLGWPWPVQAAFLAGVLFVIFILAQVRQGNMFVYQGF